MKNVFLEVPRSIVSVHYHPFSPMPNHRVDARELLLEHRDRISIVNYDSGKRVKKVPMSCVKMAESRSECRSESEFASRLEFSVADLGVASERIGEVVDRMS